MITKSGHVKFTLEVDGKSVNVIGVIDPISKSEISVEEAVQRSIINKVTGDYCYPNGTRKNIEEAARLGLVKTSSALFIRETKHHAEIKDSNESDFVQLKAFKHPETGKELNVKEAIEAGIFDQNSSLYMNTLTGEKLALHLAIDKGLAIVGPPEERRGEHVSGILGLEKFAKIETLDSHTKASYRIESVMDPKTKTSVNPEEAVSRGLIDLKNNFFLNPVTNEKIELTEAIEKGLIILDTNNEEVVKVFPIPKEKSFTIKAVKDTKAGCNLTVAEALELGILDGGLKYFYDNSTGEKMNIEEAINRKLIIADEHPSGMMTPRARSETSYRIKSVIDSKTGEEIPISDAIRHKIFDRSRLVYIDPNTHEEISLAEAEKLGLIRTEEVTKKVDKTGIFICEKPTAKVYRIQQVRDPNYEDKWYDAEEAERRGITNRIAGRYMNTYTGDQMSILEAIERGYILAAEEDDGGDYDNLPKDEATYVTVKVHIEEEPIEISVVFDIANDELLSIGEALNRKIIDLNNQTFVNSDTQEVMTIKEAFSEGFVRGPMDSQSYHRSGIESIQGVIDPINNELITVGESIRRRLINPSTGTFHHPQLGDIDLARATKLNLLIKDPGNNLHDFIEPQLTIATKQTVTVQSTDEQVRKHDLPKVGNAKVDGDAKSQQSQLMLSQALKAGLIDTANKTFIDPETGKICPLDIAISAGLVIPDHPNFVLTSTSTTETIKSTENYSETIQNIKDENQPTVAFSKEKPSKNYPSTCSQEISNVSQSDVSSCYEVPTTTDSDSKSDYKSIPSYSSSEKDSKKIDDKEYQPSFEGMKNDNCE